MLQHAAQHRIVGAAQHQRVHARPEQGLEVAPCNQERDVSGEPPFLRQGDEEGAGLRKDGESRAFRLERALVGA